MSKQDSYNITLDTYKDLTKITWMKWDEKMDSFIMDYESEMVYTA